MKFIKHNINTISEYLVLLLILVLGFYLSFIPHSSDPYPVHLDEWNHFACTSQIIAEESVTGLSSPYSGGSPVWNQKVEVGFHTYWAIFHEVTNLDWLFTIRYFPSIIFLCTILAAYVLGKRMGFGWQSALLTSLIPSTVGILGPGFLVPVALGLFCILVSMYIAFYHRGWQYYVLLGMFVFFMLAMHAATAVILIVILLPWIIINIRKDFKRSLGVSLALGIPFITAVVAVEGIWSTAAIQLSDLLVQKQVYESIDIPNITETYGYIPIALSLIGIIALCNKQGVDRYTLIGGYLLLTLLMAVFYSLHYGVPIMYYRGFQYSLLVISLVGGAGLQGFTESVRWLLKYPFSIKFFSPIPAKNRSILITGWSYLLTLILIGIVLSVTIPAHQNIPYYHAIDTTDYNVFVWIKDNLDDSYNKALLEPSKGMAFTAITGKFVYSYTFDTIPPSAEKAREFLEDGCTDTTFLTKNKISIIYTRDTVNNPDLEQVDKYIYLLKGD